MWGRIFLPAFIAVATVGATLYAETQIAGFSSYAKAVQFAKITAGVLGLFSPLLAAWNAWLAHREKLEKDAYAGLLATLAKIVDETKVAATDVGLHAYLVRRPFPWINTAYQRRIARVRLSDFPPPSTVVWLRGKGYVGSCWQRDLWQDFERAKVYAPYLPCTSDAEWQRVPEELRFGMSYAEWARSAYDLVRVYPIHAKRKIFSGYRYIGCVSLDTVSQASVSALLSPKVRELLASAAKFIAIAAGDGG